MSGMRQVPRKIILPDLKHNASVVQKCSDTDRLMKKLSVSGNLKQMYSTGLNYNVDEKYCVLIRYAAQAQDIFLTIKKSACTGKLCE